LYWNISKRALDNEENVPYEDHEIDHFTDDSGSDSDSDSGSEVLFTELILTVPSFTLLPSPFFLSSFLPASSVYTFLP
jgi:hypothetical protein